MVYVSSVSLHVGIMNCILIGNKIKEGFQRVSARRNYELKNGGATIWKISFQRVSARRNYELYISCTSRTIGFQRVSARRNYEFQ